MMEENGKVVAEVERYKHLYDIQHEDYNKGTLKNFEKTCHDSLLISLRGT